MAQYFRRRGGFLAGVLAAGLVLGMVAVGSPRTHAQIMGDLPTATIYRLGPVSVAPDETLRVSYSNVFGHMEATFSVSYVDANDGTLLGGEKGVVVGAGTGKSSDFVAGSAVSVIAIVSLAEPRPDPVLTAQLIVNGSAAWLAEPRPDPILLKTP